MGEVIKRQRGGKFIGWYIRYYDGDGKRRIKASKQATRAEARRMLLQVEAQIVRGKLGTAEPQSKLTVAELGARFSPRPTRGRSASSATGAPPPRGSIESCR